MTPSPEDTLYSVWIVVQTKPMQEVRVKAELERKGFEVYLPMKLFANKAGNLQATPFLPRYLFARITADVGRWRDVWSTIGVAAVLCRSQFRPYGVRDEVIQRIKAQEEGGFIRLGLPQSGAAARFEKGQKVRTGIDGLDGLFLERVDARRGAILINWLGGERRLVVDLSKLEAV